MSAGETEELTSSLNPYGNVQAVVESDGDTVFFYLFGAQESGFGMRSLWVRNIVDATVDFDRERMQRGRAPINPSRFCRVGSGPKPNPAALRIVWLAEGNGAGLYESDRLLAVIPPWSGQGGFNGYAADAAGDGPLAWELGEENALEARLREAQAYWAEWERDDPWTHAQEALVKAYEKSLGARSNYYAADVGNWPPRAILRIPRSDCVVLATLGMSLRPQPNVEMHVEHYGDSNRIELGIVLPLGCREEETRRCVRYLSAQSIYPWSRFSWLGAGHTFPCDSWRNERFTSALLLHRHPAIPDVELPALFRAASPGRVLWFMPIDEDERAVAVESGSETLLQRLPTDRWLEG